MQAAWQAGRFDVDQFLSEVESEQFDEFVAMDRIVPFGDEKLAWVFASGMAALYNLVLAIGGGKDAKPIKPKDLIPWMAKTEKKRKYVNPNAAAAAATIALRNLQER